MTALLVTVAVATVSPVRAQSSADSTGARTLPIVTRRQLKVGAAAAAATIVLTRFDRRLLAQSQSPRWQSEDEVRAVAKDLAFLGGPGPFVIGAAFVAAGNVLQVTGATAVGSRITESVLLAASITAIGKGLAGRALPGVETEHAFSLGRGFHQANGAFVSFPSGHTAAAFALAGALTAEAERSGHAWARFVRPIAYATATGVGVARVYQYTHWASDLPIAAVVGMWSASTIERRAKQAAPTATSRFSFGDVAVLPHGRRLTVISSLRFRQSKPVHSPATAMH